MSRLSITSTIGDLADDLARYPVELARGLMGAVREGAVVGNTVARDSARRSSGAHGKLYPRAFTTSIGRPRSLIGLNVYEAEYGPDARREQGNMSFEGGSRNQKPHGDLAASADLIGPALAREVGEVVDKVLW